MPMRSDERDNEDKKKRKEKTRDITGKKEMSSPCPSIAMIPPHSIYLARIRCLSNDRHVRVRASSVDCPENPRPR